MQCIRKYIMYKNIFWQILLHELENESHVQNTG